MINMRSRYKRAAALVVERVISALLFPVRTRASQPPSVAPARILVVRCDHIGDAVMATPALRHLRDAFPDAHISLLAGPWAAVAFRESLLVDDVIVYATPWWIAARGQNRVAQLQAWIKLPSIIRALHSRHFDLAIDLRGDLRQIMFFLAMPRAARRVSSDRTGGTAMLSEWWPHDPTRHEVEKSLAIADVAIRGAGINVETLGEGAPGAPALELPPAPLPHGLQAEIEAASGPAGYVALAIKGNAPNKSWPLARAAELVRRLHDTQGFGTVFIGGPADAAAGDQLRVATNGLALNTAGRCSLRETVAVCAGAAVSIAVDSGPMHLAAASCTPVVALFGPTDPEFYNPWTRTAAVAGPMAPCGCTGQQCSRLHESGAALQGDAPCMSAISVDHVLQHITDVLDLHRLPVVTRSLS